MATSTRIASTPRTPAPRAPATVLKGRPQGSPVQPKAPPRAEPAPAPVYPVWVKRFVIGGVLLAIAMPVTVLMSRSMLVQTVLTEESSSTAAMVCTAGTAEPRDGSSLLGWLFSGSYFQCGDWETREARVQRAREQAEANYLARQRARSAGQ